jgi:hypothetical protein
VESNAPILQGQGSEFLISPSSDRMANRQQISPLWILDLPKRSATLREWSYFQAETALALSLSFLRNPTAPLICSMGGDLDGTGIRVAREPYHGGEFDTAVFFIVAGLSGGCGLMSIKPPVSKTCAPCLTSALSRYRSDCRSLRIGASA